MYVYVCAGMYVIYTHILTGIIAYLGFGPYEEQGRRLWGQPLNYYLIPVMVRCIIIIVNGSSKIQHFE